jgi:hypothetical protein
MKGLPRIPVNFDVNGSKCSILSIPVPLGSYSDQSFRKFWMSFLLIRVVSWLETVSKPSRMIAMRSLRRRKAIMM